MKPGPRRRALQNLMELTRFGRFGESVSSTFENVLAVVTCVSRVRELTGRAVHFADSS